MTLCVLLVFVGQVWDGKEYGADSSEQQGQQDGPGTGGEVFYFGQMGTGKAHEEAGEDEESDDAVVTSCGDDDPKEHAKECYGKGAYCLRRQQVSGDDTKGGAHRPARQGNGHGAVVIVRIQRSFAGDGDSEDFIGYVEADENPMKKGRIGGAFLADYAAHEHIAGIGYQCDDGHFEIGGITGYDGKSRVFTSRGVVEEAGEESLEWIKTGVPGGNAECEGDNEIAKCDGDSIMESFQENIPAGFGKW